MSSLVRKRNAVGSKVEVDVIKKGKNDDDDIKSVTTTTTTTTTKPASPLISNLDYSVPLQRLRIAKEIAKLAMEVGKVCVVAGNGSGFAREAMRRRGWVEKVDDAKRQVDACVAVESFYENLRSKMKNRRLFHLPPPPPPLPTTTTRRNSRTRTPPLGAGGSQVGEPPPVSAAGGIPSVAEVGADDFYHRHRLGFIRQMYRNEAAEMPAVLKPFIAKLYWTSCQSKAMHQLLTTRPEVTWNHFGSRGGSFTTKEGLCRIMNDIHWALDMDKNTIMPRVYNLGKMEELIDFSRDFKVTACLNLIKYLVANYGRRERGGGGGGGGGNEEEGIINTSVALAWLNTNNSNGNDIGDGERTYQREWLKREIGESFNRLKRLKLQQQQQQLQALQQQALQRQQQQRFRLVLETSSSSSSSSSSKNRSVGQKRTKLRYQGTPPPRNGEHGRKHGEQRNWNARHGKRHAEQGQRHGEQRRRPRRPTSKKGEREIVIQSSSRSDDSNAAAIDSTSPTFFLHLPSRLSKAGDKTVHNNNNEVTTTTTTTMKRPDTSTTTTTNLTSAGTTKLSSWGTTTTTAPRTATTATPSAMLTPEISKVTPPSTSRLTKMTPMMTTMMMPETTTMAPTAMITDLAMPNSNKPLPETASLLTSQAIKKFTPTITTNAIETQETITIASTTTSGLVTPKMTSLTSVTKTAAMTPEITTYSTTTNRSCKGLYTETMGRAMTLMTPKSMETMPMTMTMTSTTVTSKPKATSTSMSLKPAETTPTPTAMALKATVIAWKPKRDDKAMALPLQMKPMTMTTMTKTMEPTDTTFLGRNERNFSRSLTKSPIATSPSPPTTTSPTSTSPSPTSTSSTTATPLISTTSMTEEVSSSKIPIESTAALSERIVELALIQLETVLAHDSHEDIDRARPVTDVTGALADRAWPRLLKYIEEVTAGTRTLDLSHDILLRCRSMLGEILPITKQHHIDGDKNIWILKPPNACRGRGIVISQNLEEILRIASTRRVICQKYIERPLTIYDTKFDIRQWFLVSSWSPLILWWYNDCYIRFSTQIFDLQNFDRSIHLTNNAVQANYQIQSERSPLLPVDNMWDSASFAQFCKEKAQGVDVYRTITIPKMKSHITCVMRYATDFMIHRENSFELYGADFMVDEKYNPWLLEINACPALGSTTSVTKRLCRDVVEDALKVALDRKKNPMADTGGFQLIYRESGTPINNLNRELNQCAQLKVSGTSMGSIKRETMSTRKPWEF